ncbi:glycosyltransferase family 2 protein [Iodobacter sp.]|uniref:glycosyltransferase family 2 protein n=1 Tax=Iodobacter sp. TaxID=1915058 RepID=UPI0025EC23CA|nr:glycosyltransferase family 2 protein [Iodobacter sp.]
MNPLIMPLVSIMMPARNVAECIVDTIRSIQEQSYSNWELIFVDDGSTDSTLLIVRNLAGFDPRIKVFAMEHGGRGKARNMCISHCSGKYVAVCDSDDVSFPDRFEKQVDYMEKNSDIACLASWWIPFSTSKPDKSSKRLGVFPCSSEEIADSFARKKMRFHNATAMLRRELFDKYGAFNVDLRRAQDYEFYSRLNKAGERFFCMNEPLVYYRQESNIPSIAYFVENGIYMAYADYLLGGGTLPFKLYSEKPISSFWKLYYKLKYGYFFLKMRFLS